MVIIKRRRHTKGFVRQQGMEIIIKPKQNSIHNAIGSLGNGVLFIVLAVYFFNRDKLFSLLIICAAIRFSIYQMIDLWFTKKIFYKNGMLFLKCWGINFRLDTENTIIRIDNMLVINPINAKFPTLNIYRNPPQFYKRLFKNKIKLYAISKSNIEASKIEAQKISDTFGIKFIDYYEED